jgi:hypothetical protein
MEEKESKQTAKKPTKRGRPRKRAEGLGDTIEQITTATGIKAAVDWFSEQTGIDCGCDARKEKLNKIFRYRKPECLTKEEYEFLGTVIGKNVIRVAQQQTINKIYNRIFKTNVEATSCGSCLKTRIVELQAVYDTYDGAPTI